MAISQNNYVSISTKVLQSPVRGREFSALVFTADELLASAPADLKTAYGTEDTVGSMITLSYNEVVSYFATTSKVYQFATKYFGRTSANGVNPTRLNIVMMGHETDTSGTTPVVTVTETPLAAFNRVVAKTNSFGSFTFLDGAYNATGAQSAPEGFGAVAAANDQFVFVVAGTSADIVAKQTAVKDSALCHVVLGVDEYAAWMPCNWIASQNFSGANSAGTIEFKTFGNETATVTTDADKVTYDAIKVNYIGLTMYNGGTLKFYQTGVNQDGVDLGVAVNEMWLKSRIEQDYMQLQMNSTKIPADTTGILMVHNMLVGVASEAVNNGVILIEKPLTSSEISLINIYSGNDPIAVSAVQNKGYYVTTWIDKVDNKYYARYRLIYAKGDHVQKLEGQNILV